MKLIKLYSPSCGPCKMLDSMMPSINKEGLPVEQVDVTEDREAMKRYGVMFVPSMVVLDDEGNILSRATGIPEIKNMIGK